MTRNSAFNSIQAGLETTLARNRVSLWTAIWVFWGVWSSSAAGQPPESLDHKFEAANRLYESGQHQAAAAAYQAIFASGHRSAALHLNQGNAEFRLNHIGRAIVQYRLGLALAPRDSDLRANLRIARARASNSGTAGGNVLVRATQYVSNDEWGIITSALFFTWAGACGVLLLRPAASAWVRGLAWGTGVMIILAGSALVTSWHSTVRTLHAVIAKSTAAVRYGPFEESDKKFDLPDGAELVVLDQQNSWYYITDRARHDGWTRNQDLLLLR